MLAILGAGLAAFFAVSHLVAGRAATSRASDEGAEHESNRAYRFGFTVAWVMYLIFAVLIALQWVPIEAALPAMGAFTGGSYCLFLGVTGLRGWIATKNASD